MNRLFGSKPKDEPKKIEPEVVQQPEAEIDLSEISQRMEAKCQDLTKRIQEIEKELAENYQKSKTTKGASQTMYKNKCINLMKKKKLYDQQLNQQMQQQFNIDQMAFTKEQIQNTIESVQAMKQASAIQKKMMKDIDLDQMEDLRDEMEEMMWDTQEMNEMMNRDYGCTINEQDLDDELANLDDEYFQEVLNQNNSKNQNQNQNQQQQNSCPQQNINLN